MGLAASGAAAKPLAGPVAAEVERVIDGDTVKVRALIWIDQEVTVSARVEGVDAPELFRPACAAEREKGTGARDFTARFLADGQAILRDIQYDKYASRVVARIENGQGADLADALLAAGLAVKDAARGAWCRGVS